ncbi:hypothetical protein WA158_007368 [Blastocystis sp. Blastoise]
MSSFENTTFALWIPDLDPIYEESPTCRSFLFSDETVDVYLLLKKNNEYISDEVYRQDLTSLQVRLYIEPPFDPDKTSPLDYIPVYIKESVFSVTFIDQESTNDYPYWLQNLSFTQEISGYISIPLTLTVSSSYLNIPLSLHSWIRYSFPQVHYHRLNLPPPPPLDQDYLCFAEKPIHTLCTFDDNDLDVSLDISLDISVFEPLSVTCNGSGKTATLNIENNLNTICLSVLSIRTHISHVESLKDRAISDEVLYIDTLPPITGFTNYDYLSISLLPPTFPVEIKPYEQISAIMYVDDRTTSLLSHDIGPFGGYLYIYVTVNYQQVSSLEPIHKDFYIRYYIPPLPLFEVTLDYPSSFAVDIPTNISIHIHNLSQQHYQHLIMSFNEEELKYLGIILSPSKLYIPYILSKHTYDVNIVITLQRKGRFSFPKFFINNHENQSYSIKGNLPFLISS